MLRLLSALVRDIIGTSCSPSSTYGIVIGAPAAIRVASRTSIVARLLSASKQVEEGALVQDRYWVARAGISNVMVPLRVSRCGVVLEASTSTRRRLRSSSTGSHRAWKGGSGSR